MKSQIESITEYLHFQLTSNAIAYLKLGLELFHKERVRTTATTQPAIGNLSIAVELMFKSFLASQNPLLIFSDLPIELKVLFSASDNLPKNANWRNYDLELRSFGYKTIELNEAISAFGVCFPEEKKKLQSYLKLLSRNRNKCIHASLPSFQRYDLERIAYLSLRIFEILEPRMPKNNYWYWLNDKDKKFLDTFDEERIERVHKKVEEAKEKAKQIKSTKSTLSADSWEEYVTECPICESEGILSGTTELKGEQTGPDDYDSYLDFSAYGFTCDECGLILDDFEELKLAGMDTSYDRTEEMDKWSVDEYDPCEDYR